MSKHANPLIWPTVDAPRPAHGTGWTDYRASYDQYAGTFWDYTPGKHAKPFGKHHPARHIDCALCADLGDAA